jgi:hypothetical protein
MGRTKGSKNKPKKSKKSSRKVTIQVEEKEEVCGKSAPSSQPQTKEVLKFNEPTCYICFKPAHNLDKAVKVDPANNVFRHHRCAPELIRRWYKSMGMEYVPTKQGKESDEDIEGEELINYD